MDLFCTLGRAYYAKHSLMNGIMGISLAVFSTGAFAVTLEGYWKSIDDRTGEQLSIVEIRKGNDGRYHGKIMTRPNLTWNCTYKLYQMSSA